MFWQRKRNGLHWLSTDEATYRHAYDQFGGSIITHPDVVAGLSALTAISVHYYAHYQEGQLYGAIACWPDACLAGSKHYLDRVGKKALVDLGNAEVILPLRQQYRGTLPCGATWLSCCQQQSIHAVKPMQDQLSFARPHRGESALSKKFKYNRQREWRLFTEAHGQAIALNTLSNTEIATTYCTLFTKRWDHKPRGHEHLAEWLGYIRHLLHGSVLIYQDQPIAVQLVYCAETATHISAEYINGGVDPAFKTFSPGSVLTWLNTSQAFALADAANKPLRYSFGKWDAAYKARWCYSVPVFRTQ